MDLLEFARKIPKDRSVDIRPYVAEQVRNFIKQNAADVGFTHLSPAASVIRRICKDTRFVDRRTNRSEAGTRQSNTERSSDYYTNVINAWASANKSKRGKPALAEATFYWFFRHVPDPSYFIEIAKRTWMNDSALLNRFCYAKEGGEPNDSFENVIDRFQSNGALSYVAYPSNEQKRLSATYPSSINLIPPYQTGRAEFFRAKKLLLSKGSKSPAVTMAIYGAGGYGKSCLAQELCNDTDIRSKFPGGIYWLQLGLIDTTNESAGDVQLSQSLDRMLAAQYSKTERPSLVWEDRDGDIATLLGVLPDKPLLLVADDLWTERQSSWLQDLEDHVSVLLTTRRESIAWRAAHEVPIKRLTDDACYKLLTHGMADISPELDVRFREVLKGFRGWPLLLKLANGAFKQRSRGPYNRVEKYLEEFEKFLEDDQIDGWDIEEAGESEYERRRKLVGYCIEAGLRAIPSSNNPDLLRALAVFPDDTDIPFSVVIGLWNKIIGRKISSTNGQNLIMHFNDFSFFSSLNADTKTFKLHDEILAYFRSSLNDEQRRLLQCQLLASIQTCCSGGWDTLPAAHVYGWTRLLFHLQKAGQADEANDLLTDFRWLKAKLAAVGASELQRSFLPVPIRTDARSVGRTISFARLILNTRPASLAHQLYGRLGHELDARLQKLAQAARTDATCWPVPVQPHLSPVGLELLRFVGHSKEIRTAVFDRNGRKVVTASNDHTARLWNAETGLPIGKPLVGHKMAVASAAFDSGGSKVVTGSEDRTARLWDGETGDPIGEPLEHEDLVLRAIFDPSGEKFITVPRYGAARLWASDTCAPIGEPLDGHVDRISSANFDPSGRKVVTSSRDGSARIWDAETGAQIGSPLEGHMNWVVSAAFDWSGERVVTASSDNTACIWDITKEPPIRTPLIGHSSWVLSAAFDLAGDKVVTSSQDGTSRLWDTRTGLEIGKPLGGHASEITSANFDPTGRKVVTASRNGTACLWHAESGFMLCEPFKGHTLGLTSAIFDPSGRKVLTASSDATARLWDAAFETPIAKSFKMLSYGFRRLAFSPSGPTVQTNQRDSIAWLCGVDPEEIIGKALTGHVGGVDSAAFDPAARWVVTVAMDGTARCWNAEKGIEVSELAGKVCKVTSPAFDPSGHKVVTAMNDGTAQLWDTKTGAQICKPLAGGHDFVLSVIFDPSGRKVLTVIDDGNALLWDTATCGIIRKFFDGHTGQINSVAFDPSGHKIVTTSNDGTAVIWDADTSDLLCCLKGHSDSVISAAFNITGQNVATVSNDCTVRIWNTLNNSCVAVIDYDRRPEFVAWHHNRISVFLEAGGVSILEVNRDAQLSEIIASR